MTDQNARVLDQFGQQAEAYSALVSSAGAHSKDPLIEALSPRPTDHVLDVGCGSGQFAIAAAPLVAHVTGADLTPAMLAKARAQQAGTGLTNITWLQADSTALPVADGSFDIVVSRSMFHHAADPAATLAEMRRACARDGRIAVMDLTPAPAKAPAFDSIELLRDPSHQSALTADELRALGAGLGLTETLIRPRATSLPIETVLATSFPAEGMLDHVRALYARDADTGADAFGMGTHWKDGAIWVTYPMTLVIWAR